MGAVERVFHREFAETAARNRAEGRAEERQLIKECFIQSGMSPEEFDRCIASLKIK